MALHADNGDLRETYANFFKVGYNSAEFLLDFGRRFEGEEAAGRIYQRVVTTPAHAKVLSRLLRKSVSEYEKRFGKIAEEET